MGKSKPWPWQESTAWEQELERVVDWLDIQQDILQLWLGRLEALLARHWPEVLGSLKLNSVTLLRILAEIGSPAALNQEPKARAHLSRWGGRLLKESKITAVLESARTTVGVRMSAEAVRMLRVYAQEALLARQEVRQAKRKIKEMSKVNEIVPRMGQAVGDVTACVLWTAVGDPRKYHCGHAYLKALGLNLKERSSGKYEGKLKITKRGPSRGRRWLYFSSMRAVQQAPVRAWFEAKKRKDKGEAVGALVAVMRKLALAVHAICVGQEPFSLQRLFPGRPWPRSKNHPSPSGALPPDPRNLSLTRQSRKGKEGVVTKGSSPPDLSTSAPGTALGSVSTGALSSAQSKKDVARTR
jgi:transposase